MRQKIHHKKRILACVVSAVMLASVQPSLAQPEGTAKNSLIASYQNYENARFAVRWEVDPRELTTVIDRLARYRYLVLYSTSGQLQGGISSIVQFGFFKSKAEADRFVKEHGAAFKGLSTVLVTPEEHQAVFSDTSADVFTLSPDAAAKESDQQVLFSLAKDAYINNQYEKAINLYSVLSLSSDTASQVWAQELVGVNLERLGSREEAKAVYSSLLSRHPEGSWVARIQQRLRALETAPLDGKDSLRRSKYEKENKDFYWRGIFGQSYSYLARGGKYFDQEDELAVLGTHFDLTAGTTKWQGHELETRFSGYDLMDNIEGGGDAKTRIKRLYLNYTHTNSGLKVTGGRQRDDEAGVYGYFDGLSVEYPWLKKLSVGAKAGVPIRFTDFYDALDHKFFSVYGDYQFNEDWVFSAYLTHQTLYSEVDRAAYGGKAQFTGEKLSTFVNIDFDYEFAELNIFRWGGNYVLSDKSRFSAHYGYQRSPFLSSTNIRVGQPYLNIREYLNEEYNRKYLVYSALQRTAVYEFGTLSYYHQVDEDLQVSLDFYQSVSDNVPVFESEDGWITSDVSFYGAYRYTSVGIQAVASNFVGKNDTATMSYRYGDTTYATNNTVQFSERFRLGKSFIVNPKIGLRQSKNKLTDVSQTRIRASLSLAYKPWRNTELRLEGGNEVIQDLEGKNTVDNTFLYAGYQVRF